MSKFECCMISKYLQTFWYRPWYLLRASIPDEPRVEGYCLHVFLSNISFDCSWHMYIVDDNIRVPSTTQFELSKTCIPSVPILQSIVFLYPTQCEEWACICVTYTSWYHSTATCTLQHPLHGMSHLRCFQAHKCLQQSSSISWLIFNVAMSLQHTRQGRNIGLVRCMSVCQRTNN